MSIGNWRLVSAALLTIGILAGAITTALPADEQPAKNSGIHATGPVLVTEFDQLFQKLTRMSKEKVWSIPWQLSVREARELAAKEKKPVFLWISSNGGTHPLGPC